MTLEDKTIGIIGVGNMGKAILLGLIDGGIPASRIRVRNRREERTKALVEKLGVVAAESNRALVEKSQIVLLAVKPQIMADVLRQIAGVGGDPLFISVAAGVSTARIEELLGGLPRVVRAMPNTPALVNESATAISAGARAAEAELSLAMQVFQRVSKVVVTVEEQHLDAVTGLSGSGPAYIMLIIEAFADAGVKVGLSREIALQLAVQTIAGSARLLQVTGEHPGKLKDQVTSPGGTAIAGLHTLEEGGLRTTIMNAVERATQRAKELGQG